MTEKETISKAPSGRPKREPVGTRNRLSLNNKEPGFVYRFVNATDGRVEELEAVGYEVVDVSKHKIGNRRVNQGSSVDNSVSVGGGVRAVVMRQREDYYHEDQSAKQKAVAKTEAGVKNPSFDGVYGEIKTSNEPL